MSTYPIGKRIKEIRKKLHLTQKELAEGICTQAQISNIEKGELNPTSNVLFLLSKKLNVDMNFFFDIKNEKEELNEVVKVKNLMRKFIRTRDYESLSYIIEKEKENSLFNTPADKQFLIWHDGICEYYNELNVENALRKLKLALDFVYKNPNDYSEREIEILNSIAIIYNEESNNDEAISIYTQTLDYLEKQKKFNVNIKIRVLYGLSKALTDFKDYEKSIVYSKQGIELCVEIESLYLLGELLYQTGINLLKINRIETGNEYLNKAIAIFEIQGNSQYINIIKNEQQTYKVKN